MGFPRVRLRSLQCSSPQSGGLGGIGCQDERALSETLRGRHADGAQICGPQHWGARRGLHRKGCEGRVPTGVCPADHRRAGQRPAGGSRGGRFLCQGAFGRGHDEHPGQTAARRLEGPELACKARCGRKIPGLADGVWTRDFAVRLGNDVGPALPRPGEGGPDGGCHADAAPARGHGRCGSGRRVYALCDAACRDPGRRCFAARPD
mmetsp:Transcript_33992/g.89210  ORF Transcript_33992/g.89210 Transcript_33992/m.89210 type:complete len:206 (+) Transcript_33992:447-1064(+)